MRRPAGGAGVILNIAILAAVTLQRLSELWISRRNTKRLLACGAREFSRAHYPFIIAVHSAWIAALWWLAPNRAVDFFWLGLLVLLAALRAWVMLSLGRRWTTRIIVIQGPLVRRGPYRFLAHPNYLVVMAETLVLPLVFGLWSLALLFAIVVGAALWVRVRAEDEALKFAGKFL
jgi:methyltransferase